MSLPGNGVGALLPDPNPRTSARSKADFEVREAIAHAVHLYELSSSETMAMLCAIASSYAMAIRRQHDAEGSR